MTLGTFSLPNAENGLLNISASCLTLTRDYRSSASGSERKYKKTESSLLVPELSLNREKATPSLLKSGFNSSSECSNTCTYRIQRTSSLDFHVNNILNKSPKQTLSLTTQNCSLDMALDDGNHTNNETLPSNTADANKNTATGKILNVKKNKKKRQKGKPPKLEITSKKSSMFQMPVSRYPEKKQQIEVPCRDSEEEDTPVKFSFSFAAMMKIKKVYTHKKCPRKEKYESIFPKVEVKQSKLVSPENGKKPKEFGHQKNYNGSEKSVKKINKAKNSTKVYLSEGQSKSMMGIPSVPPTSPSKDNNYGFEVVPCMSDTKSQRIIQSRLSELQSKQRKKEARIKELKEQKIKEIEKKDKKKELNKVKQQQRAEIYALNKIMAELELTNFETFQRQQAGLQGFSSLPV